MCHPLKNNRRQRGLSPAPSNAHSAGPRKRRGTFFSAVAAPRPFEGVFHKASWRRAIRSAPWAASGLSLVFRENLISPILSE